MTALDKSPSTTASKAHVSKTEGQIKSISTPPRLLSKPIKQLSAPFLLPTQYIDLTPQQAAKILGKSANKVGNISVENNEAKLDLSTSGGEKISYASVDLKQMGKCSQSREFDSKPFLLAVGINPKLLEFARKQSHYHTYYDHKKKVKVAVACIDENWPYTIVISRKYYLQ